MKHFFLQINGDSFLTFRESEDYPAEKEFEDRLNFLNGESRWALLLGALPEGMTWDAATRQDYLRVDDILQVGGSADRLLVQIGRTEGEGVVMYNISLRPSEADSPQSERIDHADGGEHTMVRPEEVLTAADALPIFIHYYRNHQTLPSGLWLRDFNDATAAAFQEDH